MLTFITHVISRFISFVMETLENAVFLSLKQKALTLQLYKDLRFGKVTFLSNSLVITLKTALFSKGF